VSDQNEAEALRRAFDKYQTGEKGTMDAGEFFQAVQTLCLAATLPMAAEAFSVQDSGNQEAIGFNAFCAGYQAVKVNPNPTAHRCPPTACPTCRFERVAAVPQAMPKARVQGGEAPAGPANGAPGKSFTGSKGGGRYTNVAETAASEPPMPNSPGPAAREGHQIQLDMWEDGRFEYRYVENKDSHPDGPEILSLFLDMNFGTKEQKAFRGDDIVQKITTQLALGGISSMRGVRGSTKRQLDDMGLSVGVRAIMVEMSASWTPPTWDDPSFTMEGKWSAGEKSDAVQVTFVAATEKMAAYDNVQVPSCSTFVLDGEC